MAGVKGFEPLNAWTKTRCLTAWRYPIASNETKSVIIVISVLKVKILTQIYTI